MKEQKQKVSSPLFSALQGKALLEIVLYNSLRIFCTFIVESPSLESLLDRYHILHLQPMVDIRSRAWRSSSIVGLIVEDLWSVRFLTIQRTGFASSSSYFTLTFLGDWMLAILKIILLINCQRECLVLFLHSANYDLNIYDFGPACY